MKKTLACLLCALLVVGCFGLTAIAQEAPVKISLFYSDNATLPYKEDWLTFKTAATQFNAILDVSAIPSADYATKVSTTLNAGVNTPDIILATSTSGSAFSENAAIALNGGLVAISDYPEWTPNFWARVEEYGIEDSVDMLRLGDGKLYVLPSVFDKPFYDGGLILREDFLDKNGFDAPETFDDLYAIMKEYKNQFPDSYPMTVLAAIRVHYRMTMPSWGVSVSRNSSTGSWVLSWDYEAKDYFQGAISEEYRDYMRTMSKWYAEGLFDPELAEPIDGDMWMRKLATGASMASYAYYDQIGGIVAASEIPGIAFQMYPPLTGPGGAHHQPKSSTGTGIIFPIGVSKRADFERVVRTVDEIFFSEAGAKLWCLGVEGETYFEDANGLISFPDAIQNSPNGIYKAMQLAYGTGADPSQLVWVNAREMIKYDENYANINARVADMDTAIQYIPPAAQFDDLTSEEVGFLKTPLADTFDQWANAFLTGQKSVETDWDAYVKEMKDRGIDQYFELYQANNYFAK